MRKTALLFLVLALVAAIAPSALAAPTVSGYFETVINYNLGATEPFNFGTTLYRVNVSGDVSENLSYYGRIQGASGATENSPAIKQAYMTLKNVGVSGLSFGVGRQSVWWSRLNNYPSTFGVGTVDGVTTSYAAGPVSVKGYYKVTPGADIKPGTVETLGGKLGYSADVAGGVSVAVDGLVQTQLGEAGGTGYGVSASIGLDAIGDVYAEYTKSTDDNVATVVGANIAVLEEATGISAWAEYDVKGKAFAFEASRDIISGLNLAFGGSKGEDPLAMYVKATVSASF